jgi:hypothetical protein
MSREWTNPPCGSSAHSHDFAVLVATDGELKKKFV